MINVTQWTFSLTLNCVIDQPIYLLQHTRYDDYEYSLNIKIILSLNFAKEMRHDLGILYSTRFANQRKY